MARDEYNSMSSMGHDIGLNKITLSLSMLAGGGVLLMIMALLLGVLNTVDGAIVTMMLVGGLILLVIAVGVWMGVERPHERYDDINVPLPDEHGHGHDHAHEDEHAHDDAPPADSRALEQAH